MNNNEILVQFAKETMQRNGALMLPGAPNAQSLRTHYIDLRVSDSEGGSFPASELLGQGARLVLVGNAGSGKTTALRHFAIRKAEEFINGISNVLPIYIPLHEFPFRDAKSIIDFAGLDSEQSNGVRILVMLDGLDELQFDYRVKVLSIISELSTYYLNSQIIVASRPAGLSPSLPDEFRFYHLESLDSTQTCEIISKLAKDTLQCKAFEDTLDRVSFLDGFSQNPLLIHLLWQVYNHQGQLPTVRADLYQTTCDFLLSTWDAAKGIERRQNILDLHSIHQILESVAFDAFTALQHHIPFSQIKVVVEKYIEFASLQCDSVHAVVDQLLSSGILIKSGPESVSFVHLTFMEFYAAKRLVASPRKLASLLVEVGPIAKETMLFAAGMILDVAPLVEAAVDRRELILAANCLREGRTENYVLEAYVLDQLKRELGFDLIRRLAGDVVEEQQPQPQPQPESIHSKLHKLLSEIRDSELSSHEKGKRFENFAERFFRQSFNVIDLNLNTENGEMDLILEKLVQTHFGLNGVATFS